MNPKADSAGNQANITFYSQPIETGKTFEYEIMINNPTFEMLLTDSISNSQEIKDLMVLYKTPGKTSQDFIESTYSK